VIDLERVRSRFLLPAALSARLPLGVLSIDWSASLSSSSSSSDKL
jgi:hypothetical protein